MNRVYMCIDLKSFYASVECVERNLNPLTTNLVVASKSRTDKTVCLAVSPSLKQYGIPGRARLYEVKRIVNNLNKKNNIKNNKKSYNDTEIKNKHLLIDFIIAPPQMKKYMEYSAKIYSIYLKFLSPDDIYVYSIDEVFCDITSYLKLYNLTPIELTSKIINEVYKETGITATSGIGTNLYLAKVSMDIVAKHIKPDKNGVRIASLDETSYRKTLWNHTPITSFWRIGNGIAKKLQSIGLYTMGDIARCSINHEDILYKLFGVNAELIIDHAWGYEPCTIKDIKDYKPINNSLSSSQVLHTPYDFNKSRLIVREMIDLLSLDLVNKKLITNQINLSIGYDIDNLNNSKIDYTGDIVLDWYGRPVPKSSNGLINLDYHTSSSHILSNKCIELYDKIVNKNLLVRRINISVSNLIDEDDIKSNVYTQLNLFDNSDSIDNLIIDKKNQKDDIKVQRVINDIKNKYGKNSILKGMNLEEYSTAKERNKQIGGHNE